ncbi:MAG: hypothetical protein GF320_07135 [Armatimonadia bacterium]|nr:hypothetical protein [Armatimonadia bacterium]
MTVRDMLRAATLDREDVDRFLDESEPNWARFHPDLGYALQDCILEDGLNGAATVQRIEDGHRKLLNYADRPCRINTYGDSFTQCAQVSDGETWQEVLAAHLGEPIRNYGVGGYGVYQAYLRMVANEPGPDGTPYVVLNIWGDDHHRSMMAWRWLACYEWWDESKRQMFHCNPWRHVRIDPETLQLEERPNLYPTPESLYQLCDEEHVYEAFHDDLVTKLLVAQRPDGEVDDLSEAEALGEALGLGLNWSDGEGRPGAAKAVWDETAWLATLRIIEKAKAFLDEQGKELLILWSYPDVQVIDACHGRQRGIDAFDWHAEGLRTSVLELGLPAVDTLPAHVDDYHLFSITPEAYAQRYYIGHYAPLGNHFFAHAIRDELVAWLDPAPLAYRAEGNAIRFDDYLPG